MLRCAERLEPGDTHTIGAAMEQLIASSTGGAFPLLEGKYRVELGYGGSEVAPLDWTGALTAWLTLKSVPIGFGEIHGLDHGVRPPFGRYVARGLTVVSDEMDDAIKRLIDAAIAKGLSYRGRRLE